MTGGDWHDPFAEDEAARERERRRAEREARRRESRHSLGEKVGESQAEQATGEQATGEQASPPSEPPSGPPPVTATPPPAATPSTPPAAPPSGPPPTEAQPAQPPDAQAPPTVPGAESPPATGEQTAVQGVAPRGAEPATPAGRRYRPASAAAQRRAARRDHAPSREGLWVRRVIGLLVLVGICVLIVVAALALIDRVAGGDEEPPRKSNALAKGEEIVVPEGLDRRQIAAVAEKAGLKGDYAEASKSFKGFDPAKYGAEGAPNLEGFLFPATYEVPKKGTVKDLIARQLEAFEANIGEVKLSYAKSKNLSVYDVLKIASMIEREIMVPEERPLAAAVIYNRLAAGDTLGIDATLRYYLQNYDEQLTESELADPHPYNTRINPGLPPTPIGNPGLASIEAAANPAKSDAYYFVVKPGTCGEHVFVETEEEFAQAEAEYQAALQEQGGSPTDC
jgi:cell division protein YceG involved in septum cleavage